MILMKRSRQLGQANPWIISGVALLTLMTLGFRIHQLAEKDRKDREARQVVENTAREFHQARDSAIRYIQEVQKLRAANLERIESDLSTLNQIEANMRNRLQTLDSIHSKISHLQDQTQAGIETSQQALSRLVDYRTLITTTIKNQGIDDGSYDNELLLQSRQIEELGIAIRDLQKKRSALIDYGKSIDAFRDAVAGELSDVKKDRKQLEEFRENGLRRQKRSEENQRRLEDENRKLQERFKRIK